jgi:hypothetical protein
MNEIERVISENALRRLALIFHVPFDSLKADLKFGVDLKASFISDFRRNELDMVSDDIHDVASKLIAKEIRSGHLNIRTVGEYCDYMVRCSKSNLKEVEYLLQVT